MDYIITLCCLLLFYLLAIKVMGYIKWRRAVNFLTSVSIYVLYLYVVYRAYTSVGVHDWNFQNTLPVANVSPFTFSLMPLLWFLPKRCKRYLHLLICLLCAGMLLSPIFNCVFNAMRAYAFHAQFVADYVAHVLLSLWGIYLVKSRQVELTPRDCVIGGSLIVGVALAMLVHNVIFDTAFFGLSLSGKHNIYNVVLVDSSLVSALLYFSGLIGILLLGYGFQKALTKADEAAK